MATETVQMLVCDHCGKKVRVDDQAADRWLVLIGELAFRNIGESMITKDEEHKDFCTTQCLFQAVEELRTVPTPVRELEEEGVWSRGVGEGNFRQAEPKP